MWGGRALETKLGRALPVSGPVGESWDLVDRVDAQSVVDRGEFKGTTLHELWKWHREAVFGRGYPDAPRFPLLFKILDASELLSVQVHPPESVAQKLNGEPKTEAWFFLETTSEAEVYAGFRKGITRESFEKGLRDGELASLLHKISVQSGDALLVASGRCHAIGAGCLIAELQQNSDTTYRVYDWDRIGLDGKPRELHIDESLQCIDFEDHEPTLLKPEGELVVECPYFRMEHWELSQDRPALDPEGSAAFFLVSQGVIECGDRLFKRGETFLVPATASDLKLTPKTPQAAVLKSSVPEVA